MLLMDNTHGERSQDTQREQGWQEGSKGLYLQQSSGATNGSNCEQEGRSIIVNIENTRDAKLFVVHNIKTTEEVKAEIFCRYPSLQNEKIGLGIFSGRQGTRGRIPIEGNIQSFEEVWVSVYLRKH